MFCRRTSRVQPKNVENPVFMRLRDHGVGTLMNSWRRTPAGFWQIEAGFPPLICPSWVRIRLLDPLMEQGVGCTSGCIISATCKEARKDSSRYFVAVAGNSARAREWLLCPGWVFLLNAHRRLSSKTIRSVIALSRFHLRTQLALASTAAAMGSLLAASLLPGAAAFAADPPHLVAFGPTGTVKVGSTVGITARVQGATGVPVYQFRVGNHIMQRYSTTNHFTMSNVQAGKYTVTVRSLGMFQFQHHQWTNFRSQTIHFAAGGPPQLVASGPQNGVAKHGSAFIRARVINAMGEPYFRFTLNGKLMRRYSHQNYLVLHDLASGSYTVQVKSLGPAQFGGREWWAARVQTVHFSVPSPTVTAVSKLQLSSLPSLTANGTSSETLTVTATGKNGQPVSNAPINFISSNPSVAAVSSQLIKTNSNGVAQATVTAGTTVGQATVTALSQGVSASGTISTTAVQAAPSLSTLKVAGQQAGSGTASAPAIMGTGSPMTVTTTLTGRSGQPDGGVDLTYTVMPNSSSGSLSDLQATVNGKTVSGTQVSGGGFAYTVPTDNQGTAALSLTENGNPVAATVSVSAPFANYQGTTAADLIWENAGTAVLTPTSATQVFGTSQNPGQGSVALTATVVAGPGVTVANQPVSFSLNSGAPSSAFFSSNSSGTQNSGRVLTVQTNSVGQAVAYVDDVPTLNSNVAPAPGTASSTVTATYGGKPIDAVGTSNPQQVNVTWGTAGYPSNVNLASIPSAQTTGTPQTISGQLTDVTGQPVSGATVRLVPVNAQAQPVYNGTDGYVSNGQTTVFSAQNPYASATTDSKGNFSFTVTDSTAATDTYMVEYQPSTGSPVTFGTAGMASIKWQPSIQPASLSVAPALSSLSAGQSSESVDTNENASVTSYVEAFTQSGNAVSLSSSGVSSVSYQLAAASGSRIIGVNGVTLSSPTSTITVTVKADGTVSANGQALGTVPAGASALPFAVEGIRSGSTSVGISADNHSAQVNLQVAGTPHKVIFSPATILPATVLNSGPVTETLTIEGANGHPVPSATVAIDGSTPNGAPGAFQNGGQNDAIWVTSVNGSRLTIQVNGQTQSDAFPLVDAATHLSNLGYQTPSSAPGVHFQNGVMMATANGQGQITLTLRGAGAGFWSTANGAAASSTNPAQAQTSRSLTDGTYGLGTWYQGTLVGSSLIGNASNPATGTAPSSATLAKGAAVPLTFTFNDAKGNPVIGAQVTFSASSLSHATYGTSATASSDTTSDPAKLNGLVTNSKGQVTIYVVDGTSGDQGSVSAAMDGIQLTSGKLTVGS